LDASRVVPAVLRPLRQCRLQRDYAGLQQAGEELLQWGSRQVNPFRCKERLCRFLHDLDPLVLVVLGVDFSHFDEPHIGVVSLLVSLPVHTILGVKLLQVPVAQGFDQLLPAQHVVTAVFDHSASSSSL
jgi:uncharacterized protein (DUF58 family)